MTGFWQKRRAAVAAEAEAEAKAVEAQALAAQDAALAARSDEDLLAECGLPAPEALVSGEQLRAFLKAQLPQRLKTRALRSFWKTNPVLACLDGLNDYDDDYTAAATAGKPVNTIYQVGRGMVAKVEDLLEGETSAEVEDSSTTDVVLNQTPQAKEIEETASQPQAEDAAAVEEVFQPAPTQRRMRFQFADDAAQDLEGTGA